MSHQVVLTVCWIRYCTGCNSPSPLSQFFFIFYFLNFYFLLLLTFFLINDSDWKLLTTNLNHSNCTDAKVLHPDPNPFERIYGSVEWKKTEMIFHIRWFPQCLKVTLGGLYSVLKSHQMVPQCLKVFTVLIKGRKLNTCHIRWAPQCLKVLALFVV